MQKPFTMVLLLTSTAPVCNNWVFLCLSCVLIFLHLYDPNRQPGGWREWAQQGADSPDPERPVQGLPRYCRPLPAGAASGGQVCRRNCPTLHWRDINVQGCFMLSRSYVSPLCSNMTKFSIFNYFIYTNIFTIPI